MAGRLALILQIHFMVDRGFDTNFHAVSEAVHWLLTGREGQEDTLIDDGNELLPTLDFLVKEAGMSANVQVLLPWTCGGITVGQNAALRCQFWYASSIYKVV